VLCDSHAVAWIDSALLSEEAKPQSGKGLDAIALLARTGRADASASNSVNNYSGLTVFFRLEL
jgi:hypothetical protein